MLKIVCLGLLLILTVSGKPLDNNVNRDGLLRSDDNGKLIENQGNNQQQQQHLLSNNNEQNNGYRLVRNGRLNKRLGACDPANDAVNGIPGYYADFPDTSNQIPYIQFAGFVEVNPEYNAHEYYFFSKAINPTTSAENIPVVVWLNGGPGASSLTGLFYENGPYTLYDNLTVGNRPYTWNEKYHMLFVDNPVGTGYSYTDDEGYVTNEDEMGYQFSKLLYGFLDCHPEFKENPFYITGESYAGRYIPFIAKYLLLNTTVGDSYGYNISLQGLAIGNGLYDPNIQFFATIDYAYNLGILDTQRKNYYYNNMSYCLHNLSLINQTEAANCCVDLGDAIYAEDGGNILQYDVRVTNASSFTVFNSLNEYCNSTEVKKYMNAEDAEFKNSDGTSHPNPVYNHLATDIIANNSAELIPLILATNTRILFYNGQFDGSICTNIGNTKCLDQFNYQGTWIESKKVPVNGGYSNEIIGYIKESDDKLLSYFIVSNSGHLVPYNQPQSAQWMIQTYIDGSDWY